MDNQSILNSSTINLRPNIAFAGRTAAGKTTHAKILADELGYEYVSATQMILDILNMKDTPNGIWFTKYNEIQKHREGDLVDIELENRMTRLANSRGGLVLDTWAMAWLYEGSTPMIRLWIESDIPSRTRKCYVSQGKDKKLTISKCQKLINKKDNDTRNNFLRRLDFDLYTDREKYDIILDNSILIPKPSQKMANIGIAKFAPVIRKTIEYMLNKHRHSNFDNNKRQAKQLILTNNELIKKLDGVTNDK